MKTGKRLVAVPAALALLAVLAGSVAAAPPEAGVPSSCNMDWRPGERGMWYVHTHVLPDPYLNEVEGQHLANSQALGAIHMNILCQG